ncbi:Crp/Fnr family transcriptional regulator [Rhodovulum strictum]|uniref:Cyclic nucleotide-binding domain-containing protein n=1 Tax=Rhodovulum strictum TaxID=58314 RepID=A0A844B7T4_9RHOB|nr:Crp/Fnr family transcriptional regulator [Rhodovulum strictum]MRH20454.1 cyclic nucleotide-binding domain-containing protein [Rhodovulum strictum]
MKSFPKPSALIQTGWLSRSTPEFRRDLIEGSTPHRIAPGQYLYHTGDETGALWGLESGSVAIEFAHSDHLMRTAFVLHRGHWLGEGTLFDGRARVVGVRALRESVFFGVPMLRLRGLLSRKPQYWREFGRLALEHFDVATGIAADGMIPDGRRRFLAVLMRLSGLRDTTPPEYPEVNLSKEELGAVANLSRSSLTPILRDLEAKGVITLGYRSLRVIDPVMLGAIYGRANR